MAVREQLETVGIKTEEKEDSLTVYGRLDFPESYKKDSSANVNPLKLSSYHDHRMAMCAILISVILDAPVELDDVQCLNKSFPQLLEYLNISD